MPSCGDTEAAGNAHPIVPEHGCVRWDVQQEPLPGWGQEAPTVLCSLVEDLAKPEPGQLIWRGWRSRAGHFSFFLGTDWFKFVSQ